MDLYIFDRDISRRGLLDNYFSLRWTRRYHRAGEFELHAALTDETLGLLHRENIVWKRDDLEAGYIEHRELKQDSQGQEVIVVRGKFLTGYLARRIVWGIENWNMSPEKIIRVLIERNCIAPDNPSRAFPMFGLGDLKDIPGSLRVQIGYKNLLEAVEGVAVSGGLGIRTLLDAQNKELVFDIYRGLDRTAGQSENPPAIFSREFENVFEQEYIDSLSSYRNLALVAGEGEGTDRELVTVGEGEGLDRHELYVDARDLRSVGEDDEPIPVEEYTELLAGRGASKLGECKEIQTFDSKVNLTGNLRDKEDFDLGDIVTVTSKRWGVTVDARITEIEEVYEPGGREIYCTFGSAVPTLIDKIRQVIG